MRKALALFAVMALFAVSSNSFADLTTKNAGPYTGVTVGYRPTPSSALGTYTLGSLSAKIQDQGTSAYFSATFTINTGAGAPPASFFDDANLHFLQVVTNVPRNDPATYLGKQISPAAGARTLPIVDVPAGGWDYMYTDGAARTMPDPAFAPYFIDNKPWYYTENAEQTKNTSTGDPLSKVGVTYNIEDVPADRTADATSPFGVQFSTYLVAESPVQKSTLPNTLLPNQLLVLGAVTWHNEAADISIESIGDGSATGFAPQINTALTNGGINGWTAFASDSGMVVVSPEPGCFLLLGVGFYPLLSRRFRAA